MPPTGLICSNPTWEPLGHPELSHCPLATLGGTFLEPRRGRELCCPPRAGKETGHPSCCAGPAKWETTQLEDRQAMGGGPSNGSVSKVVVETLLGFSDVPLLASGPARFALEAAWEDALQASYPDKPLMGAF